MPGWVYAKELSDKENELRCREDLGEPMAYPWVSTSNFKGGDILPCHAHGSDNSHLVVKGTLAFHHKSEPEFTRKIKRPGSTYDVAEGVSYGANIYFSDDCEFIEGHRRLSVSTRDRFISRGTITWSEDRDHEGPVDSDVEYEGQVTVPPQPIFQPNRQTLVEDSPLLPAHLIGSADPQRVSASEKSSRYIASYLRNQQGQLLVVSVILVLILLFFVGVNIFKEGDAIFGCQFDLRRRVWAEL